MAIMEMVSGSAIDFEPSFCIIFTSYFFFTLKKTFARKSR
jgi:hypothetical protein